MTEPSEKRAIGRSVIGVAPLPAVQVMPQFVTLVVQVAHRHENGKLQGNITPGEVTIDGDSQLQLPEGEQLISLGGTESPDLCPPELPSDRTWQLPTELTAARAVLETAGVTLDPRRIDVYQLGALLCFLLTGQTSAAYLRSAKVRGLVPATLRPLLDGALGHDADARLETCEQLVEMAKQLIAQESDSQKALRETPATRGLETPVSRSGQPIVQPPALAPLGPESRLGAYELLTRIGGGGMGDVYKAHDEALDRIVAVKVLAPELALHRDFVVRFRAEAMAIAKFTHPNIVQIYSFGEDAGRHFFAMQYIEGQSLATRLQKGPRPSLDEALSIFEQCLAGLGAAHRRGLIHRDIKPGNVLLDHEHERALLADFGLVKSVNQPGKQTATGVIMGTLEYISPEQARGHSVDGRSDLYSLGVVLYEMLSGQLPFVSDSAVGLIFQHSFDQPRSLAELAPQIPRPLAAIVMRLLAKNPEERYATAQEVLLDLEALRAGRPIPSTGRAASATEVAEAAAAGLTVDASEGAQRGLHTKFWRLFLRHAPQVADQLAKTELQVDGAVVQYERQRDELAALAREMNSVAEEFATQAASHRQAAALAAVRAQKSSIPEAAAEARDEQARCERTASELESQQAEQREQTEEIQLRLSKVNATLQQLRAQRDAMRARLRAAQQQIGAGTQRHSRILPQAIAAAGLLVLLVGAWMLSGSGSRKSSQPIYVARSEEPSNASKPVQSATAENFRVPGKSLPEQEAPQTVDGVLVFKGLLVTQYPRMLSQDAKQGGFVPRDELVHPVGSVSTTPSLGKWQTNKWRNVVAEGFLKIDEPGEYQFVTSSFYDRNALYVDGTLVSKYQDGDKKLSKIKLQPGLIPIASVAYVAGRENIEVKWAPPGQQTISEIPAERFFYPADLRDKRVAEIKSAEEKLLANVPPITKVDTGDYNPGLRMLEFGQLISQTEDDKKSYDVPPRALTIPLGPPTVLMGLAPWKTNRDKNSLAFGYLRIDREGDYRFYGYAAFGHGRVYLDGNLLYNGYDGEEIHTVHFKPGLVPLILESNVGSGELMLIWQRPGEIEPSAILRGDLWHDPGVAMPATESLPDK